MSYQGVKEATSVHSDEDTEEAVVGNMDDKIIIAPEGNSESRILEDVGSEEVKETQSENDAAPS